MTVGDWLDARSDAVPPQLAASIRDAVGAQAASDAAEAPEVFVAAADRVVTELLAADRTGRDSALALLAADALATYAFEAAAGDPRGLEARAVAALRTLSTDR